MKHFPIPLALAAAGLLFGTVPEASAYPATKDSAEATLTFNLMPTASNSGTSAGTVVIDVTRLGGVATSSPLEITLAGLVDGTYSVAANLKSDAGLAPVAIGSIAVSAVPTVPPAAALTLPAGLDPFNIGAITISNSTPAVILSGIATETITKWTYMGNQPVTSPVIATAPPEGHGPKPKKLHGHILIQSRIVGGVEQKRKFLLVAQGATAGATLTIKVDGVAVGSVAATKSGKLMLKSLDGDFRLAGTHLVTITDAAGLVIAQADFFPSIN